MRLNQAVSINLNDEQNKSSNYTFRYLRVAQHLQGDAITQRAKEDRFWTGLRKNGIEQ